MKNKILKILAVMSLIITSFPSVPVFALETVAKTVQVGPEETYTSLQELFDGMADEGAIDLTVKLTGNTSISGNVEVPRNKGIESLKLVSGVGNVSVNASSNAALFANGAELTIDGPITFNENISIYGGGNNKSVAGDAGIYIYDATINGAVYAGSLNGSIDGKVRLNLSNAKINTAVFGSNGASTGLRNSDVNSSNISNLYLGNINANTSNVPDHMISRSNIDNIYISKNGTVSGDVNLHINLGASTIGKLANGSSVNFNGTPTIIIGLEAEDGDALNVTNIAWGSETNKPSVYIGEKSTLKIKNDSLALNTVEMKKKSEMHLSGSYSAETLKIDDSVIYLANGKTFTVNKTMQGDAKVSFSKTYQEGDTIIATPTNNSTSIAHSAVEGISLIKGANANNTIWTYSEDAVITVNVGEGGTTPKNSLYATKGEDFTVSFAPNEGYILNTVKINGVDVTSTITGQTITLTNVQSNQTIDIEFKTIDLASVKEIIDALPNQYNGTTDRDAILNAKILFEDFGGKSTLGTTYAQKMNDALMLLPQIEFATSSKHATVTNPEAIISSMTKADAEKLLDDTYKKIVFGIYEDTLSSIGRQVIMDAQLYGDDSRTFHLKFGKRYVYTNTKTEDTFKDVALTGQNTVNVTIIPTSAEKTPASGYNDRRVRVYYSETVWTEEIQITPEVYYMEDTTPKTTEYTITPNKLGAYVVTTWDVNSPSKDHIMIVFKCKMGYFASVGNYLPKLVFIKKDANGNATITKDLIPTDMIAPGNTAFSNEGYWSPSIDTSEGAINTDKLYLWTFNIKNADYSAVNEALEKASAYTAENSYGYADLEKAINAVVWGLNATKQSEVDAMAERINTALTIVRFKEADYTDVDRAIFEGETLILSNWVTNIEEYQQLVSNIDRTKNITQQAEVNAMAKAIRDAIAKFVYKPGDYSSVEAIIAYANSYDKNLYQNWNLVEEAINAVIYGLTIDKQDEINEMVMAIDTALLSLIILLYSS